MSIHIISVLGTSLYEPVYYQGDRKEILDTDFIQVSIINEFKEEIADGGKVTIFVTDKSEKCNWNDRKYNERDVEYAQRWISETKENVIVDHVKMGLDSSIQKHFPELQGRIECIKIPDMRTESEIWEGFNRIYDCINEEDELVFDITHSFRSIPMLVVTVVNYAKVLKKCQLKGVYYGAYEAAEENKINSYKYAPIINLTVFNEILEWTYAAESFVNYGNVDKMKEVYNIRVDKIPNEEKRNWASIKTVIKDMEDVALGIATCRGVDSGKLKRKAKSSTSVKQSYLKLKQSVDKMDSELGREIIPMIKLLEHATKEFEPFNCPYDYQIGIEIVRWSIKYHMVQQGYTALEETVKTFLCEKYGMDDVSKDIREDVINSMLMACSGDIPDDRDILFKKLTQEDRFFAPTYSRLDADRKKLVKKIIEGIPKELIKVAQGVKNYRNDINHMGFNENARTSEMLEKKLGEYFDRFESIINAMPKPDFVEENKRQFTRAFTHSGKFHADDVFSTALLQLIYPDIEITRGAVVPADFDGIVFDIGNGKYDHHQLDKRVRENGVPYAAFGLLWEEYGSQIVGEKRAKKFDEEFVQEIDLSDNTGVKSSLCSVISSFNSNWNEDADNEEQFWTAVAIAKQILEREIANIRSKETACDEVRCQVEKSDNQVLVLEKPMPWKEVVVDTDILYVVLKSDRGGYIVQAVPQSADTNELKKPFPSEWRGAARAQLAQLTGVRSFSFCHVSGFLCVTETKEDAIRIAELAVQA